MGKCFWFIHSLFEPVSELYLENSTRDYIGVSFQTSFLIPFLLPCFFPHLTWKSPPLQLADTIPKTNRVTYPRQREAWRALVSWNRFSSFDSSDWSARQLHWVSHLPDTGPTCRKRNKRWRRERGGCRSTCKDLFKVYNKQGAPHDSQTYWTKTVKT